MGAIHSPQPALLLVAASSRYAAALDWARDRAAGDFGPLAATSPAFDFTETDYYAAEMGGDLKKQFWVHAPLIDPGRLPAIKRATNAWEAEYAAAAGHPESRPLNLDPGYLTLAKLVLGSTKDHAHRIYLGQGIYAEVTLSYRSRQWQPHPWTYPDYRRDDFQEFFSQCRELLRGGGGGSLTPGGGGS
ncbi:MAG: GTP-binding protein [Planctomycetaceae bacterium]|nr:GTP-binding protein [Planctomycetaceae bacterium]